MTSCPEVMVLRIWRFWKRVSWELTVNHVGRQLGCLPLRQTVGVGVRLWWWEVGPDHDVEKLTSDHMKRKTFKNCLSPRVEEPKSEINKRFFSEQRSHLCIWVCQLFFFFFLYIHCCYWYHYGYGTQQKTQI